MSHDQTTVDPLNLSSPAPTLLSLAIVAVIVLMAWLS